MLLSLKIIRLNSFCKTILPQTNSTLSLQILTQNVAPSFQQISPPSNYPNFLFAHSSTFHPPLPSLNYSPPSSVYKKHLVSEIESQNFSEREVARIMEKEVGFYRDLEKLRKKIQKDHNLSVHEIFKRIDVGNRNFIDFER